MAKLPQTSPNSMTATALPRLAVSAAEAAGVLGVGRTLLLQLDKTGELGPRFHRLGTRKVLVVDELRAWLAYGCPPRPRWSETWARIVTDRGGSGGGFPSPAQEISGIADIGKGNGYREG